MGRRHAGPPRSRWVSSEPSPLEVEDLIRRFPEVVRLPAAEVSAEEEMWAAEAVVLRSLGRRVAPEAVAREFQLRAGLKGQVAVLAVDQGHYIARFLSSEDRDRVLGRPWVVSGQLLAVERWTPRFRPSPAAISSVLVWLRLPLLPVELWGPESLHAIASFAGDVVAIDEWTLKRSRGGFAKVCVRLDLSLPLRPGVTIDGPAGGYWQSFVYEHAGGVCLACGCFHDAGRECAASDSVLGAENIAGEVEAASTGRRSPLGPWLFAVKQWLPGAVPGEGQGRRSSQPSVVGADGSSSADRPDLSPAPEGWSKPAKVARRGSPLHAGRAAGSVPDAGRGRGVRAVPGGRFNLLQTVEGLGPVELGIGTGKVSTGGLTGGPGIALGDRDLSSLECDMPKPGLESGHAKRPRSPARLLDRRGRRQSLTRAPVAGPGKNLGTKAKVVSPQVSSPSLQALGEIEVDREEGGVFTFVAGASEGTSATMGAQVSNQVSHGLVAQRLRQVMQTEEDGDLVEGVGIAMDDLGVGASGAGPSHPSTSQ